MGQIKIKIYVLSGTSFGDRIFQDMFISISVNNAEKFKLTLMANKWKSKVGSTD